MRANDRLFVPISPLYWAAEVWNIAVSVALLLLFARFPTLGMRVVLSGVFLWIVFGYVRHFANALSQGE